MAAPILGIGATLAVVSTPMMVPTMPTPSTPIVMRPAAVVRVVGAIAVIRIVSVVVRGERSRHNAANQACNGPAECSAWAIVAIIVMMTVIVVTIGVS
jgi:hypothetical protein